MHVLAPWAILWGAAGAGALIWLWRLAASRRQTRVASLIPFERLLRRTATQRRRLVTNLLFWLQLAALLGLAAALAHPVLSLPAGKRVLVLIDTSASMGAVSQGSSALDRAKRAVGGRLGQKAPNDAWLIVTTSPAAPLLPHATADHGALARAVSGVRASHLSGNLATAARLGAALLGAAPDQVVVASDEPAPAELPPGVRFLSVGRPAGNVAIVGLDAQGAFCVPSDARVFVTVRNFSARAADVQVIARADGRELARAQASLAPQARAALPLALPAEARGVAAISLETRAEDALEADNTAWVDLDRQAALPLVLDVESDPLRKTVTRWLSACKAVSVVSAPPDAPYVRLADRASDADARAAGVVRFLAPRTADPRSRYWLVDETHPIGAYLEPVAAVAAPLMAASETPMRGTPAIAAIVNGQRVPVIQAIEQEGRRLAELRFSPLGQEATTPVLLAFFNSLRWVMGSRGSVTVGEPLVFHGFAPGEVRIARPDGAAETVAHQQGPVRYDATTVSGLYEARQGRTARAEAVNFLDPVESNVADRASTWHEVRLAAPGPRMPGAQVPLDRWLLLAVLAVLAAEWWRYAARSGAAPR